MQVLGVDLATRRYRDIGLVRLAQIGPGVQAQMIRPADHGLTGTPTVTALATLVAEEAWAAGAAIIAIDGPQAWQAADNGLAHMRSCEGRLHTQAKTGLPGHVKPGPALRFVQFAIDFFDALAALGWPRQQTVVTTEKPTTLEVWPTAVWRALGIKPLPAKRTTAAADAAQWLRHLAERIPVAVDQPPTHDEVQALMVGLVGLAFASGDPARYLCHGQPPVRVDDTWREGFIVNLSPDFSTHL
jgi:hypothetical protein